MNQTLRNHLLKERDRVAVTVADLQRELEAMDLLLDKSASASNGTAVVDKPKKQAGTTAKKKGTPCPDCGERQIGGSGMSAHRRQAHGWEKGMDLYAPMPNAEQSSYGLSVPTQPQATQ